MRGLFTVPLLHDEPLSSFLSRVSRANGAGNVRIFCRDMGLNRSALNGGSTDEIKRLSDIVDIPFNELFDHAIVVDASGGALIKGSTFPKRMLRRSKLRFCPTASLTTTAMKSENTKQCFTHSSLQEAHPSPEKSKT